MSIFKACDIRGVYGTELNESTAHDLGRAVGTRLLGDEIVVGGDLRPSTQPLKQALIDGLQRSGAHVVDLGILPTPAFYYGKQILRAAGGVMVTASHNPARYNGFKLMLGDLPILPEDLQSLAQQMRAKEYVDRVGSYRQEHVLERYQTALWSAFPHLRARRIVVDAGNGSMGPVAPRVLERAGQVVEPLFCEPDGTFPHRDPNPAVPEHLDALAGRVVAVGGELGVAYDGDGDRAVFVDGLGRVISADRILVLMLRYALRKHAGGRVVYDLKSSSVVADETRAAGGVPIMERSGHAFIKRTLIAEDALLGGEISGHFFYGELGGDDALYATLYLLDVLDGLGVSLQEALRTVPSYPITPDIRLPCPSDEALGILDQLRHTFRDLPISQLDGVRIQFPHGWALARISVTEPLITLRFEAQTDADLKKIQARVRGASAELDALMGQAGI